MSTTVMAPDVEVTLSTGEAVPLQSLYSHERLALVFLRHFGCLFCKEHVAQLRRLPECNIAFVTLGTPEQTEEFRKKMNSPHKFISDPEKKLHRLFDLKPGGMAQVINPHVIVRSISAMFSGFMNSLSGVSQLDLPGVFVIDTDGSVSWEHRGRDVADNVSPSEIQKHLGY
ncbi:MAG TPA: peroxiredoxin-like family protein [Fimbriimonadaceae bacterium]|nr:peroxiredoxin-like family protein [Fimbriimonadaceae bacterium]